MLSKFFEIRRSGTLRHRGVTLIGYGLIVALLSIAAMGATSTTGRQLADCIFPSISSALDGDGFNCQLAGPGEPGDPDNEEDHVSIAFAPVYDIEPGALATSPPATAEGFQGSLTATVRGPAGSSPEFSVDGGMWVTSSEVTEGSSVRLRAMSPDSYNSRIVIFFEIGSTVATWEISSGAEIGAPLWLVGPALPNAYTTLEGYSLTLEAEADSGSSIHFYEFVEGTVPPGMAYSEENSVLSGTPTALGTFKFTLAVEDNAGRRNERVFSIQVQEAAPLASETPPNRLSITRGSSDMTMTLLNGSDLGSATVTNTPITISFDEVVLLDQIHWDYGLITLEALVEGSWEEVAHSITGKTFAPNEMVASNQFRLFKGNRYDKTLDTLHFGTLNPLPVWSTPAGAVGIVNGSAQTIELEGSSASPWDPELLFQVAPGSSLPAGVTLSSNGQLEISSIANLSEQVNFTVRLYDGVGFYAERTFALLPDMDLASETSPDRVTIMQGSRDRTMALMNGAELGSVTVTNTPITITFDEVVLLDQIHWDYGLITLEALVEGSWEEVAHSITGKTFAPNEMVASNQFRLFKGNRYDKTLDTLHFGTLNPLPVWSTPAGAVGIVNGSAQTIELEGSSASPWDPELLFQVAPGSSLPAGATLSPEGILHITEDTTLDAPYQFTARIYDGVGFYAERAFVLETP